MSYLLKNKEILKDIKTFSIDKLETLCDEVRETLIDTVSINGGHLASNLGVVELTVAMHRVFDSPKDQFIFDVGHQCYTHKLLTGRYENFYTLRKVDGISGFPKPNESEHDTFVTGHSSTSISAACGLASAKKIKKEDGKVIAVIGDGSFTGGMVYEGLNNAGQPGEYNNMIVILNDNAMSISKNVGGMARYLAVTRTKDGYISLKKATKHVLKQIPIVGSKMSTAISKFKGIVKNSMYNSTMFEDLGFVYLGPVDGHNLDLLTRTLDIAKQISHKPVLIHVNTVKGKGFSQAEENPGAFHGVSNVDLDNPSPSLPSENSYSTVFGKTLVNLGGKNDRICAITAAMKYATGLNYFRTQYPNRFFDVGIAEQHAVTFSAGLARADMIPVFAVYSSFLQRAYDQILHDCAISESHVVIGVDRAGIVGDDGETHQGVFDTSFLNSIPGITIFSPYTYEELSNSLEHAVLGEKGLVAVRYPRGSQNPIINEKFKKRFMLSGALDYDYFSINKDILVCTYGREFSYVANAFDDNFDMLKINRIKPIHHKCYDIAKKYSEVYFFEEGMVHGGIGEHFVNQLVSSGFNGKIYHRGIDDRFVPQSTVEQAIKMLKLDSASIAQTIKEGKISG